MNIIRKKYLKRNNNHPTAAADKKILRGSSCSLSLSPSPSLTLSLYLSTFSLSLSFFFSLSILSIPHPHPYIGLISTLCLSFFSLSLVLLPSFFNLNLRSYGQLFVLVYLDLTDLEIRGVKV